MSNEVQNLEVRVKVEDIEKAIEVIEWAIDYRQDLRGHNFIDELHQLRQGKAYMELVRDMLYGTSELLEMDKEIVNE